MFKIDSPIVGIKIEVVLIWLYFGTHVLFYYGLFTGYIMTIDKRDARLHELKLLEAASIAVYVTQLVYSW